MFHICRWYNITSIALHEALSDMLYVCSEYADTHNILFKTKCIYFDKCQSNTFNSDIYFMGRKLEFVSKCKFLGYFISDQTLDRHIQYSIKNFNRKYNEVKLDCCLVIISTFCMDVYAINLWSYSSKYVFIPLGIKIFLLCGSYLIEHMVIFYILLIILCL